MTDKDPTDRSSQPTTGWRQQPPPDQPTTHISQPTVASTPQTSAQPSARPRAAANVQPPTANTQPPSSGWG
ncbi:MAG: hypothetical protein KA765_08935, partial [Thermoflexales bacterium]|nr:hypothetical protein [Thermoflexales bacterium]